MLTLSDDVIDSHMQLTGRSSYSSSSFRLHRVSTTPGNFYL